MKYIAPLTKDGKIQHVTVALKNRDVMVGYIEAFNEFLETLGDYIELTPEIQAQFAPCIDSSRFNNYIEDGLDSTNMTDEQIQNHFKEKLKNVQTYHPENKSDILDVGYFAIDCECGNFVSFKTKKDLPEKDYKCDICDRVLIQYLGVDDEEIELPEDKQENK